MRDLAPRARAKIVTERAPPKVFLARVIATIERRLGVAALQNRLPKMVVATHLTRATVAKQEARVRRLHKQESTPIRANPDSHSRRIHMAICNRCVSSTLRLDRKSVGEGK